MNIINKVANNINCQVSKLMPEPIVEGSYLAANSNGMHSKYRILTYKYSNKARCHCECGALVKLPEFDEHLESQDHVEFMELLQSPKIQMVEAIPASC